LSRAQIEQIEPPAVWTRPPAEFVADLSGSSLHHALLQDQPHERHGTYRNRFADVRLFGHHHLHALIDSSFRFDCQDITRYEFRLDNHVAHHPGRHLPIPQITKDGNTYRVDMSQVTDANTVIIPRSVYFGTPIEPLNWGMWLLQGLPGALDFLTNRPAERLLVYVGRDWQRALLNTVGIPDDKIVHQELGQTYFCEEVVMRQYSHVDLVPTTADRDLYDRISREFAGAGGSAVGRRIFLSRRSVTLQSGGRYRALLNEDELVEGFTDQGFEIIEPEGLSFADQIRIFRESELVVGLGGAALFNVVFCRPGTRVVSIESSTTFVHGHAMLFGSLGLRYGIVFGMQDAADVAPVHKKWTIDVSGALAAIRKF
jgi:capsular polysaccharide biosynthesis protein